jgi:hypothetical protein
MNIVKGLVSVFALLSSVLVFAGDEVSDYNCEVAIEKGEKLITQQVVSLNGKSQRQSAVLLEGYHFELKMGGRLLQNLSDQSASILLSITSPTGTKTQTFSVLNGTTPSLSLTHLSTTASIICLNFKE